MEVNWPMRKELYDRGTELRGAVRLVVARDAVGPTAQIYPWPLQMPPEAYAIGLDMSQMCGVSTTVTGDDAMALRVLRESASADAALAPGYFYGVIFVEPKGFEAIYRDDLPFAGPNGLWVPP